MKWTRGFCASLPRPCYKVSCKYHMLWLRFERKSLRWMSDNKILQVIDKIPQSCVLDIADDGHNTLQDISECMGVTRERVRQIEAAAKRNLRNKILMGVAIVDIYEEVSNRFFGDPELRRRFLGHWRTNLPNETYYTGEWEDCYE